MLLGRQDLLLSQVFLFCAACINKTGLQPVLRPVELVHYFGGWVKGPSKQTDRTDGGWVQSTFGAKAEQIKLVVLHAAKHLNLSKGYTVTYQSYASLK